MRNLIGLIINQCHFSVLCILLDFLPFIGLIDHEEAVVLELELEKQLKEMNARIPLSLNLVPPVSFIHQMSWLEPGEENLKQYLVVSRNNFYLKLSSWSRVICLACLE